VFDLQVRANDTTWRMKCKIHLPPTSSVFSYVFKMNIFNQQPNHGKSADRPSFASWLGQTNEITRTFLAAGQIPGLINLAGGLPSAELLPASALAPVAERVIREHPQETLGYGPIEGLSELREALAARFSSPALRLSRANVLVTTSGMQALDLVGKVLLNQGDLIATQFPTYLGALDAWRPRQPRMRNFNLDDPVPDPLAALSGAKFAYTVPNFSNPTGKQVSQTAREALVTAAHTTGVWLVEDDPYGTLIYDGDMPSRLLDLSASTEDSTQYNGPVIYLGTVSKQIAPGLRIGWVIAAPEMIEALTLAKQGSDMCTSGVTQRIALHAIESGLIEELQTQAIALYRERRDALCTALAEHLSEWFEWEVPVGGMFVWAQALDPQFDTDSLLQHAMQHAVCVSPSSVFDATGQHRQALRLNFTLNPPDTIVEGVRRLARAVKQFQQ